MDLYKQIEEVNDKMQGLRIKAKLNPSNKHVLYKEYQELGKKRDQLFNMLEVVKELTQWGYNTQTFLNKFREKYPTYYRTEIALNTRTEYTERLYHSC